MALKIAFKKNPGTQNEVVYQLADEAVWLNASTVRLIRGANHEDVSMSSQDTAKAVPEDDEIPE